MRFKPGSLCTVTLSYQHARNCWSSEALRGTASGCYLEILLYVISERFLGSRQKVVYVRSFVLLANRDEGGAPLPEIHPVGSGQWRPQCLDVHAIQAGKKWRSLCTVTLS